MSYDIPKRVDPFRKPFPTAWVVVGIALIIIAFVALQYVRKPEVVMQNATLTPPPENASMRAPATQGEPLFEEPQVEPLTVQDLREPEFPEVDHELASVI